MKEQNKTKAQLIAELEEIQQENIDLKATLPAAEKLLVESEERFHSVFETIQEGCQIIDFDWRYIFVNDTAALQGRVRKEDKLGRTIMEVYPGFENTRSFKILLKCMEERITKRTKNEFTYPDGKTRWFDLRIIPVPEGIFLFSVDITESRLVEIALKESEAKYRDLIETSQDLIWKLDVKGRFTFLNAAWEKTLGYKVEEMIGWPISDFKPQDVIEKDMQAFQKIVNGESIKQYETKYLTADGEEVHMIFNASPLFDIHDNIIGTQGTAHDITERKQAEGRLRENIKNAWKRWSQNAPRSCMMHKRNWFAKRDWPC